MNRQQRREMARRKAVEHKYKSEMIEWDEKKELRRIEMDLMCVALSLRHVFGYGQIRLGRCMTELNSQLLRFRDGELIEDLRQELFDETGLWMYLQTDGIYMTKEKMIC